MKCWPPKPNQIRNCIAWQRQEIAREAQNGKLADEKRVVRLRQNIINLKRRLENGCE